MHSVQNFSYHSHTKFSDGKNTLEEMVQQAKNIGFSELGISDHLIVHKNIQQSPTWTTMIRNNDEYIYQRDFMKILPKYQQHCDYIHKVAKQAGIKLYAGFEVDFFTYDGWLDEFKYFLSQVDYDYVITGNHFLFEEDCSTILNITSNLGIQYDRSWLEHLISIHFQTIRKAVESKLFRFLAHLDYVRRLGAEFCCPSNYWSEKMAILNALKQENIGLEFSTKGLRRVDDFYPCHEVVIEAIKRDIPIVISDDAHRTEEIGLDFVKAEKVLEDLGAKRRLKF